MSNATTESNLSKKDFRRRSSVLDKSANEKKADFEYHRKRTRSFEGELKKQEVERIHERLLLKSNSEVETVVIVETQKDENQSLKNKAQQKVRFAHSSSESKMEGNNLINQDVKNGDSSIIPDTETYALKKKQDSLDVKKHDTLFCSDTKTDFLENNPRLIVDVSTTTNYEIDETGTDIDNLPKTLETVL